MKQAAFGFFLLVLAVLESVIQIHLSLIAILILANFVQTRNLIFWVFGVSLALDLLLGNLLGLNFLILVGTLAFFDFAKKFFWPNFSYEIFPRQVILATLLQVVAASRFYNFFYNLLNFGITSLNLDLRIIPAEVLTTLILFPAIFYLLLRFTPPKQLELRF